MEELKTFDGALRRLLHDTLLHLVRQSGDLEQVRVAIPPGWDKEAFATGLAAGYAERGQADVRVTVLDTQGDPRLLSVVMHGR